MPEAEMTPQTRADLLTRIWWAGVHAVQGGVAVGASLDAAPIPRPDMILSVGKAAVSMAKAAHARFGVRTIAMTKIGHTEAGTPFEVLQASHPVPDITSLNAGARLLAEVIAAPKGSNLLLLVSGGASALVEVPQPGWSLDDLAGFNRALLASGQAIGAMNAERALHSMIKGGGLLSQFQGSRVTVLAISDTQGDLIQTIGSGIGLCSPRPGLTCETRIVASNSVARAAAVVKARELGLTVLGSAETLYQDVGATAGMMARDLPAAAGLTIWGGEPTVVLPANPGIGGRNQALALHVAHSIRGQGDVSVLVAGTDGNDGPTEAAGGLVDSSTWADGAGAALLSADSGSYLAQHGALFITGPTGTNVMDLALALRG